MRWHIWFHHAGHEVFCVSSFSFLYPLPLSPLCPFSFILVVLYDCIKRMAHYYFLCARKSWWILCVRERAARNVWRKLDTPNPVASNKFERKKENKKHKTATPESLMHSEIEWSFRSGWAPARVGTDNLFLLFRTVSQSPTENRH